MSWRHRRSYIGRHRRQSVEATRAFSVHISGGVPRLYGSRFELASENDLVRSFCLAQGIPYEEVSAWESYRQTFAALDRCGRATLGE